MKAKTKVVLMLELLLQYEEYRASHQNDAASLALHRIFYIVCGLQRELDRLTIMESLLKSTLN